MTDFQFQNLQIGDLVYLTEEPFTRYKVQDLVLVKDKETGHKTISKLGLQRLYKQAKPNPLPADDQIDVGAETAHSFQAIGLGLYDATGLPATTYDDLTWLFWVARFQRGLITYAHRKDETYIVSERKHSNFESVKESGDFIAIFYSTTALEAFMAGVYQCWEIGRKENLDHTTNEHVSRQLTVIRSNLTELRPLITNLIDQVEVLEHRFT